MRSGNPVLNPQTFDVAGADADPMTLGGGVMGGFVFGLIVTLVWLYPEILRVLGKSK